MSLSPVGVLGEDKLEAHDGDVVALEIEVCLGRCLQHDNGLKVVVLLGTGGSRPATTMEGITDRRQVVLGSTT